MNLPLPVLEEHVFRDKDFVGGDLVIDFVNTVTGRNGRPRDWIAGFDALAEWAARTGVLPKARCRSLKMKAQGSPAEAASALESARDLREMLFRVLTRTVSGARPAPADLALLYGYWSRGIEQHALYPVRGSIQLVLRDSSTALETVTHVLAVRAMDLMRALPAARLRQCAGSNCAWLFLDSSKAGRRRWCDMSTCGNDAKAKRHYDRSKNRRAAPRRA